MSNLLGKPIPRGNHDTVTVWCTEEFFTKLINHPTIVKIMRNKVALVFRCNMTKIKGKLIRKQRKKRRGV